MLPIGDEESKKIIESNDGDAEESMQPLWNKVWGDDGGQLMDFMFGYAYDHVNLLVTDSETEETIYEDDQELCPVYSLMSADEVDEAYYDREDDEEQLEQYKDYMTNYMGTKCQADDELYISKGIIKAWNALKTNDVAGEGFVPFAMKEALAAADAPTALLYGESEIKDSSISFYVDLPDGEDFDPKKLDFLNIDARYEDYSPVFEMLEQDIVLMNAIIYDGKMYFAGHDNIDLGDDDSEQSYDIVNENLESIN